MPNNNNNFIPKENLAKVEEVREIEKIENKIPSFEEFMKTYKSDKKVSRSYDLEVDSYDDIREPKKSGPMFNIFQLFQVLLNTPTGSVVDTVARGVGGGSPDVARTVMEAGRFVAEHSNEISQIGRSFSGYPSSSSSVLTTTTSYVSNYRTLWDWWANGITGDERKVLLDLGFSDSSTYSLRELKETVSFCEWAESEWPYTFSQVDGYRDFLEFKGKFFADFQKQNLPGEGDNWVKLKGTQGWKNTKDNTIWNKDKFHGNHWDVTDRTGRKIKEVDFYGRQIWPYGPKNRNKRS